MKVLVIAPSAWHVASFAGGSILRWKESGTSVHIAVPGGGAEVPELAGLLGADVALVEWSHSAWTTDADGRLALTDVFRRIEPGLTVATAATATEPKARAIGRMVFDAGFCATVPHYRTKSGTQAGGSRTSIIELDDPFAAARSPLEYVDTTEVWRTKTAAIELAAEHHDTSSHPESAGSPVEIAEIVSRTRGLQIQAEHGEAFTQVLVYGRLRGTRLMPSTV